MRPLSEISNHQSIKFCDAIRCANPMPLGSLAQKVAIARTKSVSLARLTNQGVRFRSPGFLFFDRTFGQIDLCAIKAFRLCFVRMRSETTSVVSGPEFGLNQERIS
jgi:hypothetical protein